MATEKQQQQQDSQDEKRAIKPIITVEVASKKNNSLMFGGNSKKLRGRWTAANIARHDMHDAMKRLSEIPVIPGIRIQIDFNTRTLRIYDPLKESGEGRKIWAEVSRVLRDHPAIFGGENGMAPWDEERINGATDDQMKNWLYWIHRSHGTGHLVIIEEESNTFELPPIDRIRGLAGKRIKSPFNVTMQQNDERRYTDNVPAKGGQPVGSGAA